MSDINIWQIESLRTTVFPIGQVEYNPDWWKSITGDDPEAFSAKPKENIYRGEGKVEDGRLVLDHYGFRIDLHYSSGNDVPSDFPVLGPYGTKKGPFLEVVNKWLDICPEIHRLAFGAVLIIPVANRIQGYQILQGYLHKLSLDVENSSDLIYQINRPRIIEGIIDNIAINRLSRWTVESMQFGRIEFNPIKIEMPIVKNAGNYSCKLRLDINTPIGLDELPRKSLKELFGTIVALAEEIASDGDMP